MQRPKVQKLSARVDALQRLPFIDSAPSNAVRQAELTFFLREIDLKEDVDPTLHVHDANHTIQCGS